MFIKEFQSHSFEHYILFREPHDAGRSQREHFDHIFRRFRLGGYYELALAAQKAIEEKPRYFPNMVLSMFTNFIETAKQEGRSPSIAMEEEIMITLDIIHSSHELSVFKRMSSAPVGLLHRLFLKNYAIVSWVKLLKVLIQLINPEDIEGHSVKETTVNVDNERDGGKIEQAKVIAESARLFRAASEGMPQSNPPSVHEQYNDADFLNFIRDNRQKLPQAYAELTDYVMSQQTISPENAAGILAVALFGLYLESKTGPPGKNTSVSPTATAVSFIKSFLVTDESIIKYIFYYSLGNYSGGDRKKTALIKKYIGAGRDRVIPESNYFDYIITKSLKFFHGLAEEGEISPHVYLPFFQQAYFLASDDELKRTICKVWEALHGIMQVVIPGTQEKASQGGSYNYIDLYVSRVKSILVYLHLKRRRINVVEYGCGDGKAAMALARSLDSRYKVYALDYTYYYWVVEKNGKWFIFDADLNIQSPLDADHATVTELTAGLGEIAEKHKQDTLSAKIGPGGIMQKWYVLPRGGTAYLFFHIHPEVAEYLRGSSKLTLLRGNFLKSRNTGVPYRQVSLAYSMGTLGADTEGGRPYRSVDIRREAFSKMAGYLEEEGVFYGLYMYGSEGVEVTYQRRGNRLIRIDLFEAALAAGGDLENLLRRMKTKFDEGWCASMELEEEDNAGDPESIIGADVDECIACLKQVSRKTDERLIKTKISGLLVENSDIYREDPVQIIIGAIIRIPGEFKRHSDRLKALTGKNDAVWDIYSQVFLMKAANDKQSISRLKKERRDFGWAEQELEKTGFLSGRPLEISDKGWRIINELFGLPYTEDELIETRKKAVRGGFLLVELGQNTAERLLQTVGLKDPGDKRIIEAFKLIKLLQADTAKSEVEGKTTGELNARSLAEALKDFPSQTENRIKENYKLILAQKEGSVSRDGGSSAEIPNVKNADTGKDTVLAKIRNAIDYYFSPPCRMLPGVPLEEMKQAKERICMFWEKRLTRVDVPFVRERLYRHTFKVLSMLFGKAFSEYMAFLAEEGRIRIGPSQRVCGMFIKDRGLFLNQDYLFKPHRLTRIFIHEFGVYLCRYSPETGGIIGGRVAYLCRWRWFNQYIMENTLLFMVELPNFVHVLTKGGLFRKAFSGAWGIIERFFTAILDGSLFAKRDFRLILEEQEYSYYWSQPAGQMSRELREERLKILSFYKRIRYLYIGVMGSARIPRGSLDYEVAKDVGRMILRLAINEEFIKNIKEHLTAEELQYFLSVCTGAGPSMMEAPFEGFIEEREKALVALKKEIEDRTERLVKNPLISGIDSDKLKKEIEERGKKVKIIYEIKTLGIRIILEKYAHEQVTSEKAEQVEFFFHFALRKWALFIYAWVVIAVKGGLGTLDEMFEALLRGLPVLLYEGKSSYFKLIFDTVMKSWEKAGLKEKYRNYPLITDKCSTATPWIMSDAARHYKHKQIQCLNIKEVEEANRETEDSLRKLEGFAPSVKLMGAPNPENKIGKETLETVYELTLRLFSKDIPVCLTERGVLSEPVLRAARETGKMYLVQAIFSLTDNDLPLTADELGIGENLIIVKHKTNHDVLCTENAIGYAAIPGLLETMSRIFAIVVVMQTKKVPERPFALIDSRENEFYAPIKNIIAKLMYNQAPKNEKLLNKQDLDLFRVVNTVDVAEGYLRTGLAQEENVTDKSREYLKLKADVLAATLLCGIIFWAMINMHGLFWSSFVISFIAVAAGNSVSQKYEITIMREHADYQMGRILRGGLLGAFVYAPLYGLAWYGRYIYYFTAIVLDRLFVLYPGLPVPSYVLAWAVMWTLDQFIWTFFALGFSLLIGMIVVEELPINKAVKAVFTDDRYSGRKKYFKYFRLMFMVNFAYWGFVMAIAFAFPQYAYVITQIFVIGWYAIYSYIIHTANSLNLWKHYWEWVKKASRSTNSVNLAGENTKKDGGIIREERNAIPEELKHRSEEIVRKIEILESTELPSLIQELKILKLTRDWLRWKRLWAECLLESAEYWRLLLEDRSLEALDDSGTDEQMKSEDSIDQSIEELEAVNIKLKYKREAIRRACSELRLLKDMIGLLESDLSGIRALERESKADGGAKALAQYLSEAHTIGYGGRIFPSTNELLFRLLLAGKYINFESQFAKDLINAKNAFIARLLSLDIRPVRFGLLDMLYVIYYSSIKKRVNPGGTGSALYKAAGADISGYLLAIGAPHADFESYYYGLSTNDLERIKTFSIDSLSEQEEWLLSMSKINKFDLGYTFYTFLDPIKDDLVNSKEKIVINLAAELSAMGVDISAVLVGSDDRGYPAIHFHWAPVEKKEKEYSISFIDVAEKPAVYKKQCDFYFQKAAMDIPQSYRSQDGSRSFIEDIYDVLKPGGYFVTDDFTSWQEDAVCHFADCGNDFPFKLGVIPVGISPIIINALIEKRNKVKEFIPDSPLQYGWDFRIRQKPYSGEVYTGRTFDGGSTVPPEKARVIFLFNAHGTLMDFERIKGALDRLYQEASDSKKDFIIVQEFGSVDLDYIERLLSRKGLSFDEENGWDESFIQNLRQVFYEGRKNILKKYRNFKKGAQAVKAVNGYTEALFAWFQEHKIQVIPEVPDFEGLLSKVTIVDSRAAARKAIAEFDVSGYREHMDIVASLKAGNMQRRDGKLMRQIGEIAKPGKVVVVLRGWLHYFTLIRDNEYPFAVEEIMPGPVFSLPPFSQMVVNKATGSSMNAAEKTSLFLKSLQFNLMDAYLIPEDRDSFEACRLLAEILSRWPEKEILGAIYLYYMFGRGAWRKAVKQWIKLHCSREEKRLFRNRDGGMPWGSQGDTENRIAHEDEDIHGAIQRILRSIDGCYATRLAETLIIPPQTMQSIKTTRGILGDIWEIDFRDNLESMLKLFRVAKEEPNDILTNSENTELIAEVNGILNDFFGTRGKIYLKYEDILIVDDMVIYSEINALACACSLLQKMVVARSYWVNKNMQVIIHETLHLNFEGFYWGYLNEALTEWLTRRALSPRRIQLDSSIYLLNILTCWPILSGISKEKLIYAYISGRLDLIAQEMGDKKLRFFADLIELCFAKGRGSLTAHATDFLTGKRGVEDDVEKVFRQIQIEDEELTEKAIKLIVEGTRVEKDGGKRLWELQRLKYLFFGRMANPSTAPPVAGLLYYPHYYSYAITLVTISSHNFVQNLAITISHTNPILFFFSLLTEFEPSYMGAFSIRGWTNGIPMEAADFDGGEKRKIQKRNRLPYNWKEVQEVRQRILQWLIGYSLMKDGMLPQRHDFVRNGMKPVYTWLGKQRKPDYLKEGGLNGEQSLNIISLIRNGARAQLFEIGLKLQTQAVKAGLKGFEISDIPVQTWLPGIETRRLLPVVEQTDLPVRSWQDSSFEEKVNILSASLVNRFRNQGDIPVEHELIPEHEEFIGEWFDHSLYIFLSYAGFFDNTTHLYHSKALYEPWAVLGSVPASFWERKINRVAAYLWLVHSRGKDALRRKAALPFASEEYYDKRLDGLFLYYRYAGRVFNEERDYNRALLRNEVLQETGLDIAQCDGKLREGDWDEVFVLIENALRETRIRMENDALQRRRDIRELVRLLQGYKKIRSLPPEKKEIGAPRQIRERSFSEIPYWLIHKSKQEITAGNDAKNFWLTVDFEQKVAIISGKIIRVFKETGRYPAMHDLEPYHLRFLFAWFGASLYKFMIFAGFLTPDSELYDPVLKDKPWLDLHLPNRFWDDRMNRVLAFLWMATRNNGQIIYEDRKMPYAGSAFNRSELAGLLTWYQVHRLLDKEKVMQLIGDSNPDRAAVMSGLFIDSSQNNLMPVPGFKGKLKLSGLEVETQQNILGLFNRSVEECIRMDIREGTGGNTAEIDAMIEKGNIAEAVTILKQAAAILRESAGMVLEQERAQIEFMVEEKKRSLSLRTGRRRLVLPPADDFPEEIMESRMSLMQPILSEFSGEPFWLTQELEEELLYRTLTREFWEQASFEARAAILSGFVIDTVKRTGLYPARAEFPVYAYNFIVQWFEDSVNKFLLYAGFMDSASSLYDPRLVYRPWVVRKEQPVGFWDSRTHCVLAYLWLLLAKATPLIVQERSVFLTAKYFRHNRLNEVYMRYYDPRYLSVEPERISEILDEIKDKEAVFAALFTGKDKEAAVPRDHFFKILKEAGLPLLMNMALVNLIKTTMYSKIENDLFVETGVNMESLEEKLAKAEVAEVLGTLKSALRLAQKHVRIAIEAECGDLRARVDSQRQEGKSRKTLRTNRMIKSVGSPGFRSMWLDEESMAEKEVTDISISDWATLTFEQKVLLITADIIRFFRHNGWYPGIQDLETKEQNFLNRSFGNKLFDFLLFAGFFIRNEALFDRVLIESPWLTINVPFGYFENRTKRVCAYIWLLGEKENNIIKSKNIWAITQADFSNKRINHLGIWYQAHAEVSRRELEAILAAYADTDEIINKLFRNPSDAWLNPVERYASVLDNLPLLDDDKDRIRGLLRRAVIRVVRNEVLQESKMDLDVLQITLESGDPLAVMAEIRRAKDALYGVLEKEYEEERVKIRAKIEESRKKEKVFTRRTFRMRRDEFNVLIASEAPPWMNYKTEAESMAEQLNPQAWENAPFEQKIDILRGIVIHTVKNSGWYPTQNVFSRPQFNFLKIWFDSSIYKFLLYAGFYDEASPYFDRRLVDAYWTVIPMVKEGFWGSSRNRTTAYLWIAEAAGADAIRELRALPMRSRDFEEFELAGLNNWVQAHTKKTIPRNEVEKFWEGDRDLEEKNKILAYLFQNPLEDDLLPDKRFVMKLKTVALSPLQKEQLLALWGRERAELIRNDILTETGLDLYELNRMAQEENPGAVLSLIHDSLEKMKAGVMEGIKVEQQEITKRISLEQRDVTGQRKRIAVSVDAKAGKCLFSGYREMDEGTKNKIKGHWESSSFEDRVLVIVDDIIKHRRAAYMYPALIELERNELNFLTSWFRNSMIRFLIYAGFLDPDSKRYDEDLKYRRWTVTRVQQGFLDVPSNRVNAYLWLLLKDDARLLKESKSFILSPGVYTNNMLAGLYSLYYDKITISAAEFENAAGVEQSEKLAAILFVNPQERILKPIKGGIRKTAQAGFDAKIQEAVKLLWRREFRRLVAADFKAETGLDIDALEQDLLSGKPQEVVAHLEHAKKALFLQIDAEDSRQRGDIEEDLENLRNPALHPRKCRYQEQRNMKAQNGTVIVMPLTWSSAGFKEKVNIMARLIKEWTEKTGFFPLQPDFDEPSRRFLIRWFSGSIFDFLLYAGFMKEDSPFFNKQAAFEPWTILQKLPQSFGSNSSLLRVTAYLWLVVTLGKDVLEIDREMPFNSRYFFNYSLPSVYNFYSHRPVILQKTDISGFVGSEELLKKLFVNPRGEALITKKNFIKSVYACQFSPEIRNQLIGLWQTARKEELKKDIAVETGLIPDDLETMIRHGDYEDVIRLLSEHHIVLQKTMIAFFENTRIQIQEDINRRLGNKGLQEGQSPEMMSGEFPQMRDEKIWAERYLVEQLFNKDSGSNADAMGEGLSRRKQQMLKRWFVPERVEAEYKRRHDILAGEKIEILVDTILLVSIDAAPKKFTAAVEQYKEIRAKTNKEIAVLIWDRIGHIPYRGGVLPDFMRDKQKVLGEILITSGLEPDLIPATVNSVLLNASRLELVFLNDPEIALSLGTVIQEGIEAERRKCEIAYMPAWQQRESELERAAGGLAPDYWFFASAGERLLIITASATAYVRNHGRYPNQEEMNENHALFLSDKFGGTVFPALVYAGIAVRDSELYDDRVPSQPWTVFKPVPQFFGWGSLENRTYAGVWLLTRIQHDIRRHNAIRLTSTQYYRHSLSGLYSWYSEQSDLQHKSLEELVKTDLKEGASLDVELLNDKIRDGRVEEVIANIKDTYKLLRERVMERLEREREQVIAYAGNITIVQLQEVQVVNPELTASVPEENPELLKLRKGGEDARTLIDYIGTIIARRQNEDREIYESLRLRALLLEQKYGVVIVIEPLGEIEERRYLACSDAWRLQWGVQKGDTTGWYSQVLENEYRRQVQIDMQIFEDRIVAGYLAGRYGVEIILPGAERIEERLTYPQRSEQWYRDWEIQVDSQGCFSGKMELKKITDQRKKEDAEILDVLRIRAGELKQRFGMDMVIESVPEGDEKGYPSRSDAWRKKWQVDKDDGREWHSKIIEEEFGRQALIDKRIAKDRVIAVSLSKRYGLNIELPTIVPRDSYMERSRLWREGLGIEKTGEEWRSDVLDTRASVNSCAEEDRAIRDWILKTYKEDIGLPGTAGQEPGAEYLELSRTWRKKWGISGNRQKGWISSVLEKEKLKEQDIQKEAQIDELFESKIYRIFKNIPGNTIRQQIRLLPITELTQEKLSIVIRKELTAYVVSMFKQIPILEVERKLAQQVAIIRSVDRRDLKAIITERTVNNAVQTLEMPKLLNSFAAAGIIRTIAEEIEAKRGSGAAVQTGTKRPRIKAGAGWDNFVWEQLQKNGAFKALSDSKNMQLIARILHGRILGLIASGNLNRSFTFPLKIGEADYIRLQAVAMRKAEGSNDFLLTNDMRDFIQKNITDLAQKTEEERDGGNKTIKIGDLTCIFNPGSLRSGRSLYIHGEGRFANGAVAGHFVTYPILRNGIICIRGFLDKDSSLPRFLYGWEVTIRQTQENGGGFDGGKDDQAGADISAAGMLFRQTMADKLNRHYCGIIPRNVYLMSLFSRAPPQSKLILSLLFTAAVFVFMPTELKLSDILSETLILLLFIPALLIRLKSYALRSAIGFDEPKKMFIHPSFIAGMKVASASDGGMVTYTALLRASWVNFWRRHWFSYIFAGFWSIKQDGLLEEAIKDVPESVLNDRLLSIHKSFGRQMIIISLLWTTVAGLLGSVLLSGFYFSLSWYETLFTAIAGLFLVSFSHECGHIISAREYIDKFQIRLNLRKIRMEVQLYPAVDDSHLVMTEETYLRLFAAGAQCSLIMTIMLNIAVLFLGQCINIHAPAISLGYFLLLRDFTFFVTLITFGTVVENIFMLWDRSADGYKMLILAGNILAAGDLFVECYADFTDEDDIINCGKRLYMRLRKAVPFVARIKLGRTLQKIFERQTVSLGVSLMRGWVHCASMGRAYGFIRGHFRRNPSPQEVIDGSCFVPSRGKYFKPGKDGGEEKTGRKEAFFTKYELVKKMLSSKDWNLRLISEASGIHVKALGIIIWVNPELTVNDGGSGKARVIFIFGSHGGIADFQRIEGMLEKYYQRANDEKRKVLFLMEHGGNLPQILLLKMMMQGQKGIDDQLDNALAERVFEEDYVQLSEKMAVLQKGELPKEVGATYPFVIPLFEWFAKHRIRVVLEKPDFTAWRYWSTAELFSNMMRQLEYGWHLDKRERWDLDKYLECLGRFTENMASMMKIRDEKLKQFIGQLAEPELDIIVFRGSAHAFLLEDFRDENLEIEFINREPIEQLPVLNQLMIHLAREKGFSLVVKDCMLSRELQFTILSELLRPPKYTNKEEEIFRSMVRRMTDEEILESQRIFKADGPKAWTEYFAEWCVIHCTREEMKLFMDQDGSGDTAPGNDNLQENDGGTVLADGGSGIGEVIGVFTVTDYTASHRAAEEELKAALGAWGEDWNCVIECMRIPRIIYHMNVDEIRGFVDRLCPRFAETPITIFLTGGELFDCIFKAYGIFIVYAVFNKHRPVHIVLPKEALSGDNKNRTLLDYLSFLRYMPVNSVVYRDGAVLVENRPVPEKKNSIAVSLYSTIDIFKHNYPSHRHNIFSLLSPDNYAVAGEIARKFSLAETEKEGIIKDFLYLSERAGYNQPEAFIGMIRLLLLNCISPDLIQNAVRLYHMADRMFSIINTFTRLRTRREPQSMLGFIFLIELMEAQGKIKELKDIDGMIVYILGRQSVDKELIRALRDGNDELIKNFDPIGMPAVLAEVFDPLDGGNSERGAVGILDEDAARSLAPGVDSAQGWRPVEQHKAGSYGGANGFLFCSRGMFFHCPH